MPSLLTKTVTERSCPSVLVEEYVYSVTRVLVVKHMLVFVTFNYTHFKGSSRIKSECIHMDFCVEEIKLPFFIEMNKHLAYIWTLY